MTPGYYTTPTCTGYQKRNLLLSYSSDVTASQYLTQEVSMNKNDDSRLREFRQLKQEIRRSTEYLVVGIDVAKERHYAFFGTATGTTLIRKLVFTNTREGFEKLTFQADTLKVRHGLTKVVFGLEPTGDYHKPLGEYLNNNGHMVVFAANTAVKNNRELLNGRWDKNDTKDAANVADLVLQGKCLFYEHPPLELQELRGLLSLKKKLKKQEHAYRVRIRNHLIAQYFPEIDRYFNYGEGPAIVRSWLDPEALAEASFEQFASVVSSINGGQKQILRLKEIHGAARTSIGCAVTPAVPFEAGLLFDALSRIKDMGKATDGKIATVCKGFPEYRCLLSIPGFGPDISSKVLGALSNPHRFENTRQLLKTAGLDLSGDKSGKREGAMVISKKGKADLRYGLYQASLVASSSSRCFMEYFTNLVKGREREKGIGMKMRIKLSAKMLVIAWTLMKKEEMFDPGYLK